MKSGFWDIKLLVKILCGLIPIKKIKRRVKNNILFKLEHRDFNLKKSKIVCPPQGLGDILYILLSLENMSDNQGYSFILRKRYFQDLCSLFPSVVTNSVIASHLPYYKKILYQEHHIYKKQRYNHFLELFKEATSVDIKRDYIFPFDKNYKTKFVNDGFALGKTVLILPESVSCPNEIPKEFWVKYADILAKEGYVPVFNSSNKFADYESVFYNISETINFAECAGHIIGYRSGLCDVLSYFTNAKSIYLYPQKPQENIKYYIKDFEVEPSMKYMEFCSLKKINPQKNIQEFIFDKDNYPLFDKGE